MLLNARDIYCLEISNSINLTGNAIFFARWHWLKVANK